MTSSPPPATSAPTELPASVRYVKNGAGGRWWPDARSRSRLHAGWSWIADDALQAGDEAVLRELHRAEYGSKQGATQDLNQLLLPFRQPSRHIWVTFEDGFLWWATVRDGVTVSPENERSKHGHFWLDLDLPWNNRSRAGRFLAMSELPGIVTKTAGFKGTICSPRAGAKFCDWSATRRTRMRSQRWRRARHAVRAAGAHLLFLPPYSPDLNPIEMIFAKLKTLFRKADTRTIEQAWRKIGTLLDLFPPDECARYLRHAGYGAKTI